VKPLVQGVEALVGHTRRTGQRCRAISIPVDPATCRFLLARLKDVSGTTEAIVHRPPPGQMISPWNRDHVVQRVRGWVQALRDNPRHIFVITPLDRAVIVEAIEGNRYFADMHDTDPRLTVDAVRQANALRERIATALGQQIRRVPLGDGRRRLPAG
jgi:hypothetical protein